MMALCQTPKTIEPGISLHTCPPLHFFGPNAVHDAIPTGDHTYLLWNRKTGKILALREGNLETALFSDLRNYKDSWYWKCEEKGGWLSLRHPASRSYVGYREGKGQHSWATDLVVGDSDIYNRFCYRLALDGGYQLLWEMGNELKVVAAVSGDAVQLKSSGAYEVANWEFVRMLDG
ncbi:hypothetical protein QBC41DRAFT_262983 [Cercophora samala]|uniref:Uncharacterized protein n=1 Tax=Cercophora samala TaxID=330535 RepID=A0AA39YTD5_9PEZI|nr:hypothetical protein QBC41DRAFT_262983 [Cercophora samala]